MRVYVYTHAERRRRVIAIRGGIKCGILKNYENRSFLNIFYIILSLNVFLYHLISLNMYTMLSHILYYLNFIPKSISTNQIFV